MTDRIPIYCDCCGDELMAEWVDGKVVIRRMRKGEMHIVVLDVDKKCYHEGGKSASEAEDAMNPK